MGFDRLAEASVRRFGAFVPEDFAMLSSALSETHRVVMSTSWNGEPLDRLGEHAARSLESGQGDWSPRHVAEVLQPFASLKIKCTHLMSAAECHFRERKNSYAPRDVVRVMNSFSGMGELSVSQISKMWDFAEDRIPFSRDYRQ